MYEGEFQESAGTFVCLELEVEVGTGTGTVTGCVFLTGAFRAVEEDGAVEGEEGGKGLCCCGAPAADVDTALLLGAALAAALLRCVLSCFPVDPPPFCEDPCLTTFSRSMWVSAVP